MLFVDNWYSSLELLSELRNRSTDVVGTVRKDRKRPTEGFYE